MSIGPIGGTNAAKAALGIAAPVVAGWFVKESYDGAKDEWHRRHAGHLEDLNMSELRYSWAKYDGQPTMTKWAKRFQQLMLHGPAGLKTSWAGFKIKAEGVLHDVILSNIIPIGLGITGLYAGLGKNAANQFRVHTPLRFVKKEIINPLWTQIKPKMGTSWLKTAADSMAKGIVAVGNSAIKNPGVALLATGLTAFGVFRFKRVYNGQEQDTYFRNSMRHDFWENKGGH